MRKTIQTYIKIWHAMFIRMSLQRFLEYRFNFFLWSLVSLGWTLFNLFFYEILFTQMETVAGWTKSEAMVFVGVYMFLDTFTWSFFYGTMRKYVESIFTGKLDYTLTLPIDTQFLISTHEMSFNNLPRFLIAFYLIGTNLHIIQLQNILAFFFFIMIAIIMIYLLWFFTATWTFWVEKMDNIVEIVPALRKIWSVPAETYSGPISAVLTIIVPLSLITTVPTRALLGIFHWQEIGIFFFFTIIFAFFTRIFFQYSLKKYSSIGS